MSSFAALGDESSSDSDSDSDKEYDFCDDIVTEIKETDPILIPTRSELADLEQRNWKRSGYGKPRKSDVSDMRVCLNITDAEFQIQPTERVMKDLVHIGQPFAATPTSATRVSQAVRVLRMRNDGFRIRRGVSKPCPFTHSDPLAPFLFAGLTADQVRQSADIIIPRPQLALLMTPFTTVKHFGQVRDFQLVITRLAGGLLHFSDIGSLGGGNAAWNCSYRSMMTRQRLHGDASLYHCLRYKLGPNRILVFSESDCVTDDTNTELVHLQTYDSALYPFLDTYWCNMVTAGTGHLIMSAIDTSSGVADKPVHRRIAEIAPPDANRRLNQVALVLSWIREQIAQFPDIERATLEYKQTNRKQFSLTVRTP